MGKTAGDSSPRPPPVWETVSLRAGAGRALKGVFWAGIEEPGRSWTGKWAGRGLWGRGPAAPGRDSRGGRLWRWPSG